MKRNKLAKKLTVSFLTGAMVLSMGGMTAFAEESTVPTSFSFTKRIVTDQNTLEPKVKFDFTINPGSDSLSSDGYVITAGPADGLKPSSVSFDGTGEQASAVENGETIYYYFEEGTITVDTTKFTTPGIYSYILTENDFPADDSSYEGINKDDNSYSLYVYITDVNQDGIVEYKGVTTAVLDKDATDDEKTVKTPALVVTNTYGVDDVDTIHDLTIKKMVGGNQGDTTHPFSFKVKIDGATGEQYKVVYDGEESTLTSGEEAPFTLTHNDTFVIYGLSATDSYTITEYDNNDDLVGYTTAVTKENVDSSSPANNLIQTGTVNMDAAIVTYTNTKNVTTPTGIAMTFAPYAVMVAFAGVFAVMFLRKKREDF